MNIKFETVEDIIIKIQHLKGKTKLNFYNNLRVFYDQMIYMSQSYAFHFEDPSSKMLKV